MNPDELLEKVKSKVSASIRAKLNTPGMADLRTFYKVKEHYDPKDKALYVDGRAMFPENAVERCVSGIMSLGYNAEFKPAVVDLFRMRAALGLYGMTPEEAINSIVHELELIIKALAPEVLFFKQMHQQVQTGAEAASIWEQLERTPIA